MKTSALSTPPSGYKPPTQGQVNAATDLVSRFAKSWNQPTADGLRDLMHADTENLIPPMMKPADREGVVEHFRQVLNQLPDLRLDVQRWALAGDSVMIEWRESATVAGAPLHWMGMDLIRIKGNRSCEAQVYWDTRRLESEVMMRMTAASKAREVSRAQ